MNDKTLAENAPSPSALLQINELTARHLMGHLREAISNAPHQAEQARDLLDTLGRSEPLVSLDLCVQFDQALQMHALYDASSAVFHMMCAAPRDNMNALIALAENAFDDHNFAMATERWTFILHHDAENPKAHANLIRCFISMNAPDKAAPVLKRLQKLAQAPWVDIFDVNILAALGQTEKALDALDAAILRFPDALVLKLRRAFMLHQLGRGAEAETYLLDLLHDHPSHVGILRALAQFALGSRRFDLALQRWRAVEKQQPGEPNVLINLIRCHIEKHGGDVPKAVLEPILDQLNPANRCLGQIRILEAQRDERKTLEFIERLLRDTPLGTFKPSLIERLMLRKIGILTKLLPEEPKEEGARRVQEALSQLLELRPMNGQIRSALCDALITEGRADDAAEQVDSLPAACDLNVMLLRIWRLHMSGDVTGAKAIWNALQASRPAPQTLPGAPGTLERLDPHENVDRDGEVTLFTVIKDEIARLPWFLDYYRKIGVSRFVFIDNGSTDDSRAYLLRQPDVYLYAAHETYAQGFAGIKWINELTQRHATRGWVLYVDVDEALVFAGVEKTGLIALTDHMERHGQEAMTGFMLDVVADNTTGRVTTPLENSEAIDFLKSYTLFDSDIRTSPSKTCPYVVYQGGVRQHFGPLENLTKTPLFRGGRGIVLRYSSHAISPAVLSDATCALLHYKFTDHALARFRKDLETNTRDGACKARHQNYIRRLENTEDTLAIDRTGLHQYIDSDQLCDMGLITRPKQF